MNRDDNLRLLLLLLLMKRLSNIVDDDVILALIIIKSGVLYVGGKGKNEEVGRGGSYSFGAFI